jgi:hypothetical protein
MSTLPVAHARPRKVLQGLATRQQMYTLFNRHSNASLNDARTSACLYTGEWFEITEGDHERMFEILPPLFYRGDMFAMREFLAESVTSVFFALPIGGQVRWFHGYCDLSASRPAKTASPQPVSPDWMRAAILDRESRADRAMTRLEKLDHIWSTTGDGFRAYADDRFSPDFRGRQIVTVFSGPASKVWKLLDDLTDTEIAAKLPVQLRHPCGAAAARASF